MTSRVFHLKFYGYSVTGESIFFDVSGWKYADGAPKFAKPPPVVLLVVNVDDVSGSNAELIVHVGRVVVQGSTRSDARRFTTC